MARAGGTILDAGDQFPTLTFRLTDGSEFELSVYSSGAVGRLVWQDVLGLVQFAKSASK